MNPNSVDFYARAWAAYELRQNELCIELALKGLSESPDDPHLYLLLSQVELRRNQFAKARYNANQVIQLAPEDDSGFIALAWAVICDSNFSPDQALNEQARFPARLAMAKDLLRQAMELNPNSARHFSLKCELHFLEDDNAAALDAARTGLQFDSNSTALRRQAIRALMTLGSTNDAYALCHECLQLDPMDNEALFSKAQIDLERGDIQIACRDARECVRREPENSRYRTLYWDAIKAGIGWLRPLVAWQFFARNIKRLPETAQIAALIGGPVILGVVMASLLRGPVAETSVGLLTLLVVALPILLASERPGMALADAYMYLRDPQFRAASDPKQVITNALLAFYVVSFLLSLGLCVLSLDAFPNARFLTVPFFSLLASLFYLSPIYLLYTSSNITERAGLALCVIAISALLALGSIELYSSGSHSAGREAATKYFIAFGFVAVTFPVAFTLVRRRV